MIRLILFLLVLSAAAPAAAQTARVLSGEHGSFTRLVIELPEAADWTVGRTPRGYAFAALGTAPSAYDLSAVWDRIARDRLQSLQVDPLTGALALTLGCDCHVFPFEYQPGIVVLDIRPGPAPDGSAFEAAFAPVGRESPPAGTLPGYDWLARRDTASPNTTRPGLPMPLDTGALSLEPLRDELLEQIARGAVDGIVDMELPGRPASAVPVDRGALPWSAIRLGEAPGVAVIDPDAFVEGQTPQSSCPPDEMLDVAAWGEGKLPGTLVAEARAGLYGEFDRPEPDAILRSVRILLYLGFGAEARQHAALLDTGAAPDDLALLRSMARLVDGESDPTTPLAAMLDCDGPAALWAALGRDRLPTGPGVNRDAILRSFLALPAHLRLHLGPGLAERFLAHDDPEAARVIRDAIERAPEADKAAVARLDASADLHEGDAPAAQAHAEAAVELDGNDVESLVTLVEAHFRTLDPIDPGVAEALRAVQGEVAGTGSDARVARALVIALALSGQSEAAFAEAADATEDGASDGETLADLWHVLRDRAADDDFLRHAVLTPGTRPPETRPEDALAIAKRLVGLGFADAALAWLGPVGPDDPVDRRIVAAGAALGQGDARATVALLAGLAEPEAQSLRARALVQLDDLAAASQALAAAGDATEAQRVGLWSGDWAAIDPAAPETWLEAADQLLAEEAEADAGLLARGATAADRSGATLAAVEALLAAVPPPDGG